MGKKADSKGKEKGKGSQLVIRIDKAEREAFVTLCERLDTSAAREIRRFMRSFVAAHGEAAAVAEAPEPAAEPDPAVTKADLPGSQQPGAEQPGAAAPLHPGPPPA